MCTARSPKGNQGSASVQGATSQLLTTPPGATLLGSIRICGEAAMSVDLSTTFTGIRFPNPFLLSSAPPTESESNILRAFEAGWGGVVTKTIGLHPVVNVAGPKTKFLRYYPETGLSSMNKGRGGVLQSSWNWELISDKTLDWWVPR